MRIVLTVGFAGRERDVVVDAPAGTAVSAVAGRIRELVGGSSAELYAGRTRIDPQAQLGTGALRDGGRVQLGGPGPHHVASGLVELRALAGRDAGTSWPLARGEHLIGRGSQCPLRLTDPLSSRQQARLHVDVHGTSVCDLGSANGTRLDGRPLPPGDQVALPVGAVLGIGDTRLALRLSAAAPASLRPTPDGGRQVIRPPRATFAVEPVVLDWPPEPTARPAARLALLALAAPSLVGVTLAVVLRMPQFLLFTLLSPLMMLGAWVSDRRGRRQGRRQDAVDHAAQVAQVEVLRDTALAVDIRARRRALPDLADIALIAHGPGQRLWERRPGDDDFGTLRLGTGSTPTGVSVRRDGATSPLWSADLPVPLPLAAIGVVGLAGPDRSVADLVRGLLVQLAVLHSPRDLRVLLVASDEDARAWAWLRWLPHLRRAPPAADLAALVAERLARPERGPPDTVLLIPGAGAQRADPAVGRLLADGPGAGVLALCLDRQARRLPAECRATVTVTGEVGGRLRITGADVVVPPAVDVLLDGLSAERAEPIARDLAALRDPGGRRGDPPDRVRLLDLLGLTGPDREPEPEPAALAAAVAGAWSAYDGVPRAVLGHDGRAAFTVQLVRDGPHTLVAGTTGAGKSQLLQTLVAGLAATAPPTALQFVLVDYKGGSAFRDCARLPHTSGLVTDLDPHLTRRALRSLAAELTRRERRLAAAGADGLDAYAELVRRGAAPELARLVIVVDEFAALAQELPEFLGGLVALAARGRSLGIHLVLATQRPGGAVTPEVRANTSLRIALRVTDEGESRDIVDQPGAARISRRTPGRALIRSGTEPARLVQTAWVADRPPAPSSAVTVTPIAWPARPRPPAADTADTGPTDLQRLVTACRAAADAQGWCAPPSPWLPALPDVLVLSDIASSADRPGVVLGLVDRPDEQCRTPLTYDPAREGSLLVAGGQRSGRTTTLRTLLAAVATRWTADELHVHVLDCAGGGLRAAAGWPHCGTTVDGTDTARGSRLLTRLVQELTTRRQSPVPGRVPQVLVFVDGWEAFVQAYEPVDLGRPVDHLLRLARDGTAAGIGVVVSSDRSGLGVRLSGAVGRRIVLPLADRADYPLAGIPVRAVPDRLPPGRALLPGDDLEAQVAVISPDPSGAAQDRALAGLAAVAAPATVRPPLHIAVLPTRIRAGALPPGSARCPWLGVGGDHGTPIALELDRLGPSVLVAGPPRSGRTGVLMALAQGLLATGAPVAVVAPRRSPLRTLTGSCLALGATAEEAQRLRDAAARSGLVVLADDIETLLDTAMDATLSELVRTDGAHTVIGAGRADDLAGAFRGLGVELRRRRTGLLLCPVTADGDLLGVRLPRGLTERTPGRGFLVTEGSVTRIQAVCPDEEVSPGAGRTP